MIYPTNRWIDHGGHSVFMVDVPIEALVSRLKEGCGLWGGGAGVRLQVSEDGESVVYVFAHPTEDGYDGTEHFTSPDDAVWAYLRYIHGSCLISLTAPDGSPL